MPFDPLTLTITGKGGVGKTTFTALLVKSLLHNNHKNIFVIDADPAINLAAVHGVPLSTTVGKVVDKTKLDVEKKSAFYNGSALLEFRVWEEALIEDPRFSFLAMGYTSGRGCYCMINEVLTYILDTLKRFYDIIILDMAAGLEHISRNTKRTTTFTFLLTDPSYMGFQTVRRIIELAQELQTPMGQYLLIGNMFSTPESHEKLENLANDLQITLLGTIPYDKSLANMNLQGTPLLHISTDSPIFQKVNQIWIDLVDNMDFLG